MPAPEATTLTRGGNWEADKTHSFRKQRAENSEFCKAIPNKHQSSHNLSQVSLVYSNEDIHRPFSVGSEGRSLLLHPRPSILRGLLWKKESHSEWSPRLMTVLAETKAAELSPRLWELPLRGPRHHQPRSGHVWEATQ